MRQFTGTWQCPKCGKVEKQPRKTIAVMHACPKVQGSGLTQLKRVK